MMNSRMIKIKSMELDIPFSNALLGYALETVITMVSNAPYTNDMWLKNGEVLGINVYKKKTSHTLIYWYNGLKPLKTFAKEFLSDIERYYDDIQLHLTKAEQMSREKEEVIVMEAELEQMYIPLEIHIQKTEQMHGFPKEEKMHLFMENNKTVLVKHYPIEQSAAYHLAEILKRLELLNDMEHYIILYDILKKEPLEGRKVKDELELLCDEMNIAKTKKPMALWSTYEDYSYMKKKWKVLLRREKRENPSWKEAFCSIKVFLEPIWNAICKDEVFFGDWMPELGRFLD